MNISKSSWSYRLLTKFYGRSEYAQYKISTNIVGYWLQVTWALFFYSVICPIFIFAIPVLVTGAIYGAGSILFALFIGFNGANTFADYAIMAGLGISFWVVSVLTGLLIGAIIDTIVTIGVPEKLKNTIFPSTITFTDKENQ